VDPGEGGLTSWAKDVRRRARPAAERGQSGGVRFAFYGRTSTVEYQDPVSSAAWQREAAEGVVAGRGRIVAEFFDIGHSRRVSWRARPQARALLEAVQDPDRGFDAIVVGEYERAFAGDEFERLAPLFQRCGVEVWLPETNGPVVAGSVLHRALVTVLGAQLQREVLRARHRVLGAMRVQVVEQGRYLGGRPPCGYQLADAGPHPNRATARGAPAPADTRSGDSTACAVDVRAAAGRPEPRRYRPRIERPWRTVSVQCRQGTQCSPGGQGVDVGVGGQHPGQSSLHGSAGMESPVHRS
jgi:hypothetical protein